MPKTARERLAIKKEQKKVLMDKDFAGIKAGELMLVATPKIVADYIRKIPAGQTRTPLRLRNELARRRGCAGTCPMSTAMFIHLAAAAAIEDLDEGKSPDEVIPFWRAIAPSDKVVKKLGVDADWIAKRRALEAT